MSQRKESIPSISASISGVADPGKKKGLGVGMTGFFLIAQMAGAGFLALPRGLADTGWLGIPMMLLFCLSVAFVGTRLGKSWLIVEERWPEEYKTQVRQPYMEIAERALGRVGRNVALWSVVLNLYGSTTVHIILISEMLAAMIQKTTCDCTLTTCHCILIVGAFLIPFTWLGSPKDFWQASILAVVATAVAVVVIVVQIFMSQEDFTPEYPNSTTASFALGFGAILFAFGGAAVFPTIQNDMADRSMFWKSVIIGFSGIISLYLPVGLVGYIMIGDDVKPNILLSVEMTPAVMVAISMQIINLVCTFIISSNPVYQSAEEVLKIPNRFGIGRCATRTVLVLFQLVIGLAVPNFGKILNLIGGSLITICTFVLPPLVYMKLVDNTSNSNWPDRKIPLWERFGLVEIMAVGIVGGILSTITGAYDVVQASFSNSCFTHFTACQPPCSK